MKFLSENNLFYLFAATLLGLTWEGPITNKFVVFCIIYGIQIINWRTMIILSELKRKGS